MASGAFFNPKTALLLAPLASSTASLLFAFDQHLFLSVLTKPDVRARNANALLPAYFKHFFYAGLTRVVTFLGLTTWASVGAIYTSKALLRTKGSLPWYVATASLAVGHLLYIPAVAPPIKSIVDNEGGAVSDDVEAQKPGDAKSNVDYLNEWLCVNLTRSYTTDLGAWICAVIAVTKTFSG